MSQALHAAQDAAPAAAPPRGGGARWRWRGGGTRPVLPGPCPPLPAEHPPARRDRDGSCMHRLGSLPICPSHWAKLSPPHHPMAGVGLAGVTPAPTRSWGSPAVMRPRWDAPLRAPHTRGERKRAHQAGGGGWEEAWRVMVIKHMVVWVARCIISRFGLSEHLFF